MKPLLVSSGEPAGIGPDLCLAMAEYDLPIVVLGDQCMLETRAKELKKKIFFVGYKSGERVETRPGYLAVLHIDCPAPVVSGQLNPANSTYVLELLTLAAMLCERGEFAALVTAPVHKAIINESGFNFSGHTEFLAQFYKVNDVVMMLACKQMRVALVTTHLPLRQVPHVIDSRLIVNVVNQLNHSLINDFGIDSPKIKIAGLNPHAGESGYLGREEIDVILPALNILRNKGIDVQGPLPADTMFVQDQLSTCDAYVTMYHDQGLPVLKYVGFNEAVNITLGLPIIRTSVDHGTALELAGTGLANSGSMLAALNMAMTMALNRI